MITSTAPESAVDERIYRYPALIELDDRFAWFRPRLNGVGKKVHATSRSGAKYRAFRGAALSLMDVFSDRYMIYQYTQEGNYGFAKADVINLLVQLVIVYIQNHNLSKKKLLWEAFTTVCMLKPAFDAWKVASGAEKDSNELYIAEMEMALSRSAEIICESLPPTHSW